MIKRTALCLLSLLWIAGYATAADPKDPIIGNWNSEGPYGKLQFTFREDKTYELIIGLDSASDSEKGTWGRTKDKAAYSLVDPKEGGKRAARIDEKGQLILVVNEEPLVTCAFRREGAPPEPVPAGGPPSGEWRYAYTSKSFMPAASPPPFDVMNFLGGGKVRLLNTVNGKEFERPFTTTSNLLTIETGEKNLPKLEFTYRWEAGGKRLILSTPRTEQVPFELEWVMLPPGGFLPCDVDGEWVAQAEEGVAQELKLAKDGLIINSARDKAGKLLYQSDPKFHDYFRLWKAPFGTAITMVHFEKEMASQMAIIFKVEKSAAGLTMTPAQLGEDGSLKLVDGAKMVWKRKK